MTENIQIKDESGDRMYWTQIPNMVVNHSTAFEQSLYLIMKRTAGDEGACFKSINTLAKNMGVDKKTVSKTISKLINRKWIEEIERKKVKGGTVRQFIIIDLWKLNMTEYGSGRQVPTYKSGSNVLESGSIIPESGRQMDTKNNPEEELLRKTIFLLKDWNERQSSPMPFLVPRNIIRKHGVEKINGMIKKYGKENGGFSKFMQALKDK